MLLWHHFMGLSKLGTRLIVIFFDMHMPPCDQILRQYSMSCWCMLGIWQYHAIMCLLEHRTCSLSGLFSITGWFTWLHAYFCAVVFTRLDHAGCATNGSVYWLYSDLLQYKCSWSMLDWYAECAIPSSLEVDFGNSNLESQTLGPKQPHACAEIVQHSHQHHANQWGDCHIELKETLEGRELPGWHTWGMKISRGVEAILWHPPHWGSRVGCLALRGYSMLHRVTLG